MKNKLGFRSLYPSITIALLLSACAHSINVAPDLAKIDRKSESENRLKGKAAYYIQSEKLTTEVVTPGGGGDNVSYYPYRDIEPGFRKMLGNVYLDAIKIQAVGDYPSLSKEGVKYLIIPEIVTTSGSTGFFTWPPTTFTVDLTVKVSDLQGRVIGTPQVIGTGQVSGIFDMKGDHGLVGKIAMENALRKMQTALTELKYSDIAPATSEPFIETKHKTQSRATDDVQSKLEKIKGLYEKGLINKDDYEAKKREILSDL
jgi:hypothetical protein